VLMACSWTYGPGWSHCGSQKAVVDQVIVTSGQLTYEAKEAERLLVSLRQERDLTQGIRDALQEMCDEDSYARAG